MREFAAKAWQFVRQRASWAVGALLVAYALYQKLKAERREERARDALSDEKTSQNRDIYGTIDRRVDTLNDAQRRNREKEHVLKKRLDQVTENAGDTTRVISDWNGRNRMHDDQNAS